MAPLAAATAALGSLGIEPGLIGPARAAGGGELRFPITGGRLDARTLAGTVTHGGGLSLTRGATRVELRDFTIAIDRSPALSALVGGDRVEILTLDAGEARVRIRGDRVLVTNVVARLTAAAAGALNAAFGTDALVEGLTLGRAAIRGSAR